MMNYEIFKEVVAEKFKEYLPEKYQDMELRISSVNKVNRVLDGISLVKNEGARSVSPTIYINDMYDHYLNTENLQAVLQGAAESMERAFADIPEVAGLSLESAKDNIVFQVVNTMQNQEMLKDMPHREFQDLSIIYRWVVAVDEKGIQSTVIKDDMVKQLGMNEEQLFKRAVENTRRIFPPVVRSMNDVLRDMFISDGMPEEMVSGMIGEMPEDQMMYIISNDRGINGAVSMLYEDNLHKLAEQLETDLYILPSSVHECIAISVEMGDPYELAEMVNEINMSQVALEDRLSNQVYHYDKDARTKTLQKKYLGIESDIIKQQRVRNKNNDFSTEISYAKRTEKREIESIMDDVRENDQCLFYVGVTIIVMAESKKELDSICETIETIGKRNSCTIDTHYLKQREALNTALPIGVRQVETMRTMLTQSLAVLMPFNVQELNDSGGNYYGINQISKNINVGNRKKLINGNGFVFGVPGSGKSFFCKMEMGSVFLSGNDEIIVIDPQNEYFDIARTYGGTVVNMSTYTDNYVNPLDMDVWSLDPNDSKGMVREKGEFMLGLCEQCIGDSLNSRQKSIIDRCVRKLYIDIARSREKYIPVMSDFYDILMSQPEEEAKEIALSLELFVNGSLNIFNHQTNVDVDNRFTVYGIRDLGAELSPITMLVMMESIQQRIIENGQKGKATWLYIDEFHVLLNSEYSAKYLQQLWKKVRKQGGLCTGITQNIVDLLQNYTATTMLANSEFVALLKQANTDSSKMAEVIGVSEAQLRFVTNTASGMGLIKCGPVVIPFDNQISKDTDLYKLYNTNIHERIAEMKAKENQVLVV